MWGREYHMGVAPNTNVLPVLRPTSFTTVAGFWALPDDLVADYRQLRSDHENLLQRWLQLPAIGYARVRANKRPTFHAQPVAVAPVAELQAPEPPDADDADVDANAVEVAVQRPGPPRQWGQPWETCAVGVYALCATEWQDKSKGVELVKITSKVDSTKMLSGTVFKCTKVQNSETCIRYCLLLWCLCFMCVGSVLDLFVPCRAAWHMAAGRSESMHEGWSVVAYFKKLGKKGNLPASAKTLLTSEKSSLFKPPAAVSDAESDPEYIPPPSDSEGSSDYDASHGEDGVD